MDSLSAASLLSSLLAAGATSLVVLGGVPLAVLLVAWLLKRAGLTRASQFVANAGVAFGLAAVIVLVTSLIVGKASVWNDVGIPWLLVPFYLVVAGFIVEHWVHPDTQEGIRGPIRRAVLTVIVLSVLFWVMSRTKIWVVVLTNFVGLLLFLAVIVGILYFMARKIV
ncbi:MAG: hypothetical protein JKY37_10925 [Nannocystaceae bacterium]|nr:hypothetical protein [Nannocystaceae bacterium]